MKLPKKPRQRSMQAIEAELWGLCRKISRKRQEDKKGSIYCYTCGRGPLEANNCQLGHGYPKGACGASMKYDLRILRYQCYNCNINYGGMGSVFWVKMMDEEIGEEKSGLLLRECMGSKGKPVNARNHYLNLIIEYKSLLKQL